MAGLKVLTKPVARAAKETVKAVPDVGKSVFKDEDLTGLMDELVKRDASGAPLEDDLVKYREGIRQERIEAQTGPNAVPRSTVTGPESDPTKMYGGRLGDLIDQEFEATSDYPAFTPTAQNHPIYDLYREAEAGFATPSSLRYDEESDIAQVTLFETLTDKLYPYKVDSDTGGKRVPMDWGAKVDGYSGESLKQSERQMKLMIMDNRRFHPDIVFDEAGRKAIREYLGTDSLRDPEGNPLVIFRVGSKLGDTGVAQSFGGGRELSAHGGTRTAALHSADSESSILGFGGDNKFVDIYYTNIKNPFVMPDQGNWGIRSNDGRNKLAEYLGWHFSRKGDADNQLYFEDIVNASLMGEISPEKSSYLIRTRLKELGYDSIAYPNFAEGEGSMSFIFFEPTQLKSIRNVGTFNPNTENALKNVFGPTVATGAAAAAATGEGNGETDQ